MGTGPARRLIRANGTSKQVRSGGTSSQSPAMALHSSSRSRRRCLGCPASPRHTAPDRVANPCVQANSQIPPVPQTPKAPLGEKSALGRRRAGLVSVLRRFPLVGGRRAEPHRHARRRGACRWDERRVGLAFRFQAKLGKLASATRPRWWQLREVAVALFFFSESAHRPTCDISQARRRMPRTSTLVVVGNCLHLRSSDLPVAACL